MGKKTSNAWKSLERAVARKLGGIRTLRGVDFARAAGDITPQRGTLSDLFTTECKYRKNFPALIRDGMKQAAEYDKKRIPLLVIKAHHMSGEIACLRLDDLVNLLGGNGGRSGEQE